MIGLIEQIKNNPILATVAGLILIGACTFIFDLAKLIFEIANSYGSKK